MRLILDSKHRVAAWVHARIGYGFPFSEFEAIGLEDRGEIIAGAVFNGYTGPEIEISVAANRVTRAAIVAVFRYVFHQLGCQRATAHVPAKAKRTLSFCKRLGFVIEGRKRRAVMGDDLIVLGMLRNECRWLHEKSEPASVA